MAKMRVVQVPKAKGPFEIVERDIPQPGPGEVRMKVQACGVCHSDSLTKDGLFPNITYPRVPGHEVAGVVDALGAGVKGWKLGDRVGVGWYGGTVDIATPAAADSSACAWLIARSPASRATAATRSTW